MLWIVVPLLVLLVGAWLAAPRVADWYLRQRLIPRVAARTGLPIGIKTIDIGWGQAHVESLTVGSPGKGHEPLLRASTVAIEFDPWALLQGRLVAHEVVVRRPVVELVRHADKSTNLDSLLRRRSSGKVAGSRRFRIDQVRLVKGRARIVDHYQRLQLDVGHVEGRLRPGRASRLVLQRGHLHPRGPIEASFGRIELRGRLSRSGGRWPEVRLKGGRVRLLPGLALSGIDGTIGPTGGQGDELDIALQGSYGGANAKLWKATGSVEPAARRGSLTLHAERFNLGRIKSILRDSPLIMAKKTSVDGDLVFDYEEEALAFSGRLAVDGLNLFHPGLARDPLLDLSAIVTLSGRYAARVLDLTKVEVQSRGVTATLNGTLDRSGELPVIIGRLRVPPVPCQRLLDAFPVALVPALQGFKVRGQFQVDLSGSVDFTQLEDLELGGKVAIDRCKVVEAPEAVSAARLKESFEHIVEVQPQQMLSFMVGPDNPEFTAYDAISPHLVGAFLTTEDAAFFRHRGFIPSQFRKALARNLKRGSYRLGASTISMQTIKNVLLSHEKTLARKLQELVLVWYLEKELSKERLMEIYLNVIEFGPGIFGIGKAARHYFGKHPVEITPLEAAFFATILPSPLRRYVQYCQGKLSKKWDRYVRRVLRKIHARGHITDGDYETAAAQELVFDRDFEQLSEKECKRQVKERVADWREERRHRLKEAVLRAAPHQLDLYLRPDDET